MKKNAVKSVYNESTGYTFFKVFCVPSLRRASARCVALIFSNFFFRQYRAALLPGRSPVVRVEHPLDLKVPFVPAWVTIYLDFAAFWVRMLSFLLRSYRRKSFGAVREFIVTMGELYVFAAEVYSKIFSTTARPFYIARPRFLLIHLVDPHLMCIPSLHVMVVILTWTKFAAILRSLGAEEYSAAQIEEMKQGALAITQAILFVKQHSVNCVAAALYAMTCFDPALLPPAEAEAFVALLFGEKPARPGWISADARIHPSAAPAAGIQPSDAAEIRAYITGLYRRFLSEKADAQTWDEPLLNFLRSLPPKK
jgi:hypothetical protein